MNNSIPATVSAELTARCGGLDRAYDTHRIWIHRNGTVTTPDHSVSLDTDAEQVAYILQNHPEHTCGYWRLIPQIVKESKIVHLPDTRTWVFTYCDLWTVKATWTAVSGLLGSGVHTEIDPVSVLEYVKVYQSHGKMPSEPITHLTYLLAPWHREGGHRRSRITDSVELEQLLEAGIPVDRAASAAALDIDGATAKEVVKQLNHFGLPPDIILQLSYALPPHEIPELLSHFTSETGRHITNRLSALTVALKENPNEVHDVKAFLLS